MAFRTRVSRALAVILTMGVASCGGSAGDDPPPERGSTSTVPPSPPVIVRLAPDECRPFPRTLPEEPWSDPDTLVIAPNLSLELQGCESGGGDFTRYSYEGPAPAEPYHLIHVTYYEWEDWLVLNSELGTWQTPRSRPVFSPDGAWFATAWSDLEAGLSPSHFDIWAVEADSVRRVLALQGGVEWGAVDPRWVSSNRIEYIRVTWRTVPAPPVWFDSVATGVTRRDTGWVPDPPTRLPFSFQYHDSTEVDLTGDSVPETLRLTASGTRPLGLDVSFSVWSEGREIYRKSWDSAEYFRYEPELVMRAREADDASPLYAHVRDQLDPFFDSSAFMVVPPLALNADPSRGLFDPPDMDNDPVKLISAQLLMPLLQDSLSALGIDSTSAFRQARSLAYRSGRVHPRAQEIWDLMTAEELLTFRFNAGGEVNQRVAWSRISRRFFDVWTCC